MTRSDSNPLPRTENYIDSPGEATLFTTLDCNKRY